MRLAVLLLVGMMMTTPVNAKLFIDLRKCEVLLDMMDSQLGIVSYLYQKEIDKEITKEEFDERKEPLMNEVTQFATIYNAMCK